MNYGIIRAELDGDPLARGYSGMSDGEAAASLNTVDRTRNRDRMTATEVLNAINAAEFNALTSTDQRTVWDVLHMGDINPFGIEATLFTQVFGAGSATTTQLAAIRVESVSRAAEIGLTTVQESDVMKARAI